MKQRTVTLTKIIVSATGAVISASIGIRIYQITGSDAAGITIAIGISAELSLVTCLLWSPEIEQEIAKIEQEIECEFQSLKPSLLDQPED